MKEKEKAGTKKDKQEWLKERRKGIGSSDTPAILGVSKWRTARQVALEKLSDDPPSLEMTGPQSRGTYCEPLILKLFSERTGIKAKKPKETLVHPQYDWLRASLDGLTTKKEIVEIKAPNMSTFLKMKREGLTTDIISQVQHQLLFPPMRKAYVVVMSLELWDMLIIEQQPDEEFQSIIVDKTGEFWKNLQAGIIPDEDSAAGQVIDLPATNNCTVLKISSPEWLNAVQELREAQDILQEAEEIEMAAKAEIQRLMGSYEIAESEGFRAYWRWSDGRVTLDSKAIKHDLPDVYAKYAKQGAKFRTFKTYNLKGENSR